MITADTNVFIYAFDPADPLKQSVARTVIRVLRGSGAPVALQLIGEFQNVLRRKLKLDGWLAAEAARKVLTDFASFPSTVGAVDLALAQVASARLSYWDALMLASAREAGCTAFISEDLQDGARLFGMEIVNPFGATGPSARVCELLGLS